MLSFSNTPYVDDRYVTPTVKFLNVPGFFYLVAFIFLSCCPLELRFLLVVRL
jgi:hypothetical protein